MKSNLMKENNLNCIYCDDGVKKPIYFNQFNLIDLPENRNPIFCSYECIKGHICLSEDDTLERDYKLEFVNEIAGRKVGIPYHYTNIKLYGGKFNDGSELISQARENLTEKDIDIAKLQDEIHKLSINDKIPEKKLEQKFIKIDDKADYNILNENELLAIERSRKIRKINENKSFDISNHILFYGSEEEEEEEEEEDEYYYDYDIDILSTKNEYKKTNNSNNINNYE
jgi:hypothetical protein